MQQKPNQDSPRKTPSMPVNDPAYQGTDDQQRRIIEEQEPTPAGRPHATGDKGQLTGQPNPGTAPKR